MAKQLEAAGGTVGPPDWRRSALRGSSTKAADAVSLPWGGGTSAAERVLTHWHPDRESAPHSRAEFPAKWAREGFPGVFSAPTLWGP